MKTKIQIKEAYELLFETALNLHPPSLSKEPERLWLEDARGRVLATSVEANLDQPAFDQSAMDGVAFRREDGRTQYQLVATIAAGDDPEAVELQPGCCARIMTGAPLPRGADTVQMVEYIQVEQNEVTLLEIPQVGSHIRRRGENVSKGERLFKRGTALNAATLAALASQGVRKVEVYPRLLVGMGNTGDEIVPFHRPLAPGQIYNSNAVALKNLLSGPASRFIDLGICPDQESRTLAFLKQAVDLDILILSGGVSMGQFDYVPKAAAAAGFKPIFHKVAMKPGKPIFVARHPGGCLLFGLPGNPQSTFVSAMLFVVPVMKALLTGVAQPPARLSAPLAEAYETRAKFPFFAPADLTVGPEGSCTVSIIATAGSGDVVRFARLNALACLLPGKSYQKGTSIELLLPQGCDFSYN